MGGHKFPGSVVAELVISGQLRKGYEAAKKKREEEEHAAEELKKKIEKSDAEVSVMQAII